MVWNYGSCWHAAMLDDGAVLVGDTPAQFGAFIKSEQSRWAKVVEKAKITVD